MTNYMIVRSLSLGMMSQPTLVGEADIASIADDHMIQYTNTQHFTGRHQPGRQHMIFLARCRIAARMIVEKDDRGRRFLDGHREDFPRMHDAQRQASLRNGGIP